MKHPIIKIIILLAVGSVITSCGSKNAESNDGQAEKNQAGMENNGKKTGDGMREVHLSDLKYETLGIKTDTLPVRPLSGIVEANGRLEVPPQHEATVTSIIGANITDIKVIEGQKVGKGEVLALVAHPNLMQLQSNYVNAVSQLQYLEQDMKRQKRLFEEEVGSGQKYQKALSEYQSKKGEVKSYEAQLKQLQLDIDRIKKGRLYEQVPVVSPIDGYVEDVPVKIGQFVEPKHKMFEIVNNEHIHADLMVFEKDVYKVREGQKIYFTVESVPGKTLEATIYSVGKKFEQNPKAVHVHAEITKKQGYLIPEMYIHGRIHTDSLLALALPEEAIIEEGGKPYFFTAEKHQQDGETEWVFKPVEIRTGISYEGWIEVKLLKPLPEGTKLAWNNAYYLISEMQKSQTSHSH